MSDQTYTVPRLPSGSSTSRTGRTGEFPPGFLPPVFEFPEAEVLEVEYAHPDVRPMLAGAALLALGYLAGRLAR